MNISLTAELENYVHEKIRSGLYTSASEVIRESLRLMYTQDDLRTQRTRQQLKQAIDDGLTELQLGNKVVASEAYQRLKKKIKSVAKKTK